MGELLGLTFLVVVYIHVKTKVIYITGSASSVQKFILRQDKINNNRTW